MFQKWIDYSTKKLLKVLIFDELKNSEAFPRHMTMHIIYCANLVLLSINNLQLSV
jgi:hypothetical protein